MTEIDPDPDLTPMELPDSDRNTVFYFDLQNVLDVSYNSLLQK